MTDKEAYEFLVKTFESLEDKHILQIMRNMPVDTVELLCSRTQEVKQFCIDNEKTLWLWFLERDFRVNPDTVPSGKEKESYKMLVEKGILPESSEDLPVFDLVNLVINKEFAIDAIDISNSLNIKDTFEMTKNLDDETRPLKNVATDIVVNEFFQTNTPLFRFLEIVYTTFEEALGEYKRRKNLMERDLFFLYKGGNILRIVSSEFLLELPASATREINEFYSPFFKRSDADFAIYLNPDLENYEEMFNEITTLSYLIQDYLRDIFASNLEYYFDFPKFNKKYQRQLLDKYLDEFNEAPGFEGSFTDIDFNNTTLSGESSFYKRNPDVTLRFFDDGSREFFEQEVRTAIKAPIDPDVEPEGIMTITHNDALDFANDKGDQRIKFNLTRTKILFALRQGSKTMNVGGELIDVSLTHRDDSNIYHFFEDVERNIRRYSLHYESSVLDFNSYELVYLIEDLEYILFIVIDKPWEDRKYGKRINRLFYLNFVDIFLRIDSSVGRMEVLWDIRDLVFTPLQQIDSPNEISKAENGIESFEEKHGDKELYINSLMEKLSSLLPKIQEEDIRDLYDMATLLLTNVNVVIKTIENIRQYCTIDGRINKSDIHKADIGGLL